MHKTVIPFFLFLVVAPSTCSAQAEDDSSWSDESSRILDVSFTPGPGKDPQVLRIQGEESSIFALWILNANKTAARQSLDAPESENSEGFSFVLPNDVPSMNAGALRDFFFLDVNFDGFLDIRIPEVVHPRNPLNAFWLFDPKTNEFHFNADLSILPSVGVDVAKKELRSADYDPDGAWEATRYRWQDGTLIEIETTRGQDGG